MTRETENTLKPFTAVCNYSTVTVRTLTLLNTIIVELTQQHRVVHDVKNKASNRSLGIKKQKKALNKILSNNNFYI
jgi:hypothetical protein